MSNIKKGNFIVNNFDKDTGFPFNTKLIEELPDGTIIDDTLIDNKVLFKNKPENGGGYSVKSFDESQSSTFIVNTVDDLRNMSLSNILMFRLGIYKTISLLGYYTKNDKEIIEYTFDNTSISDDDGGSIFKITNLSIGRFITSFRSRVNALHFGARNNSGRYFVNYIVGSTTISCTSPVFSKYAPGTSIRIEHVVDTVIRFAQESVIKSITNSGRSIEIDTPLTEFTLNSENAILFTNINDSSTAIQNVGNYCIANDLTMYLPQGGYYLTKTFQITGAGGYSDDNQRNKLYFEGTGANIYFGSNFSHQSPSLGVFGFSQISDLTLNGISFKGWQNNKKWFNVANADNPPSVQTSSPLFRIMGFDTLRINNCNFEDNAGSIAIMGKDQPFGTVEAGAKVTSGGLYFTNNKISNWWQFSMTRGRGRDFIVSNNIFEYTAHKMYSSIDNACNHIYTGNIFKKCPRILFGINDGLLFTNNILDTVLLGIMIRAFSHVNYTDYGRKNIIIDNNIYNTTNGGLSTKSNTANHESSDIMQAGKNALLFDMDLSEYGGSGIPKLKGVRFTNNVCDLFDSNTAGDAIFTFSIGRFDIEDLIIKGNTISTEALHLTNKNRWFQVVAGNQVKITKLLDISDNVMKGSRTGAIAFDLQECMSTNGSILNITNNLFDDPTFNQIMFSASYVSNLIANNNKYNKADNLSTNVAIYNLASPKKKILINNDTVIKPNANSNGAHVIITQISPGDTAGIIVRCNNNNLGNLTNIIQDVTAYATDANGFFEAINNVGVGTPISNNASLRVGNLLNPLWDNNNAPKVLDFIPHGYIIYLRTSSVGTWGYLRNTSGWTALIN